MKKDDRVLMETFKGFEIYYSKNGERFVADKEEMDRHFEARTLWEIRGAIAATQTKEVNKEAIIVDSYFHRSLAKVMVLTTNPNSGTKYKVLDTTEKGYDVGKIQEKRDRFECYPLSPHNLEIYDQIKALGKDINKIEGEQESLVTFLKKDAFSTRESVLK